jgi:hypothetical protein
MFKWKIKERKRIKLKPGNRRLRDNDGDDDDNNDDDDDDDDDDDNNNNNNNNNNNCEGVVVDFDISKTHIP